MMAYFYITKFFKDKLYEQFAIKEIIHNMIRLGIDGDEFYFYFEGFFQIYFRNRFYELRYEIKIAQNTIV